MENNPEKEEEGYTPRPKQEVWLARLGLVLMIGFVIYQIMAIRRGGL